MQELSRSSSWHQPPGQPRRLLYIMCDTDRAVTAFSVDRAYADHDSHDGLPVIPFDELSTRFPPETHDMLVPLGYSKMNGLRKERCDQAKKLGYRLGSYISTRAVTWGNTHVGENVLIYENAILQPFSNIGSNVIVRSGANIGHHSHVGSHTFIASSAVTGGSVTIGERCWLGLGAVLRDNITIGDRCFIGAGAVVVDDTEPDGVYVGVPARRLPEKTGFDITG